MVGEENRMKTGIEKKSWGKVFRQKVGTEPSVLVYIGILVTSTTTGAGGSVVSALASQTKCRQDFFFAPPSIFYIKSAQVSN